jgi:hypothetical protein
MEAPPSLTRNPPPSPFLSLPSDIQHLILTDYLPYHSAVALRSTSSHFRSLVPPTTLKRLRQTAVANLLAEERTLLQKWPLQLSAGFPGHLATHMNCYMCLRSRPVTDFFERQVIDERDLGSKCATQRWCKPCGLNYGKIGHGRWMREVHYGHFEQSLYENVMGTELNLKNPCKKYPFTPHFDNTAYGIVEVWWGCVGCFEKEEERLQRRPKERWRNLCASSKQGKNRVNALVGPKALRKFARELRVCGRDALVDGAFEIYWWMTKESLVRRACRTCGRMGQVLGPRKMQQAGQRLGQKAKRAAGAVLELAKKKHEREEACNAGDVDSSATDTVAGGIACCADAGALDAPPVETEPDPTQLTLPAAAAAAPSSPSSSSPSPSPSGPQADQDICLPASRREVRCLDCWRPQTSRRCFRYKSFVLHQSPLPKKRWCDGCLMEHERFVASERERKRLQGPAYVGLRDGKDQRKIEKAKAKAKAGDEDRLLWTLYGQA